MAKRRKPGEVLSIEELSVYLSISQSTLYKLAQEGGLPGQKVGRRWRFLKGAIDEWLRRKPDHLEGKAEGIG